MHAKSAHQLRIDEHFAKADRANRAHMSPLGQWLHRNRRLIAWAVLWLVMLPLMYALPKLLAFVLVLGVLTTLTAGQNGRLPGKDYGP